MILLLDRILNKAVVRHGMRLYYCLYVTLTVTQLSQHKIVRKEKKGAAATGPVNAVEFESVLQIAEFISPCILFIGIVNQEYREQNLDSDQL